MTVELVLPWSSLGPSLRAISDLLEVAFADDPVAAHLDRRQLARRDEGDHAALRDAQSVGGRI